MRLMVGVLAFGAGVFASKYFVPKVAVAVEKMKHDTEVIISNEAIIKQMCVDQIVRWYYDGNLDSEVINLLKERRKINSETQSRFNDLRNEVPFWTKLAKWTTNN